MRASILLLVWCSSFAEISCTQEKKPRNPSVSVALGELTDLAGNKTDKGRLGHNYTEIYERFLFPLQNESPRILEIGIARGGSLAMWAGYLPKAMVFGIDIEDKSAMQTDRVKTFVADQAKREELQKFLDQFGGDYDWILDDGGHTMEQQQVSFGFLFKSVKPGGYYIIEDVHTSLPKKWPGYGVEPDGANSTLMMINSYMAGVPPSIESKYMLPEEKKYLTDHIEWAGLFFRNNAAHSMTCIFRKRAGQ